ncbi:Clavaminate synthase-like protein [Gonapodya prolifera JEL478]|uniref:Clavaminate synthase-like protein n=1 Tax=Gonapodya prolifera (strain JEL478) TaxID=1344416 RepID=A0A139ALQ7_GONPJ|nr:Clavaminate synthase-like protein [Gonapodya prolifera JEL478]|eukprot:KXS17727.1 Clavaminate synthase-like protein [Gonapodya prolifera JEL478]
MAATHSTADKLEFAPLEVIDLSLLNTPRRHEVITQVDKACREIGFFAIVNFPAISREDVDRAFEISKNLFALPLEEKKKFDMEARGKGNYFGYKAVGQQTLDSQGTPDGNEFFNTPKTDTWLLPQPEPILSNREFLDSFLSRCHAICTELLEIFAEVVEVPLAEGGKEFFKQYHRYQERSGDQLRMVRVQSGGDESAEQLKMAAHTDFGTTTLVFSQPVMGLQIELNDGTWKYVRHHEGAIIVNIGDAMQFWTNGYLRSNFHRVVRPPAHQNHLTRYSLVYFLRPENSVLLNPIKTPKTIQMPPAAHMETAVTAEEWIKLKVLSSLRSNVKSGEDLAKVNARISATRGQDIKRAVM